MTPEDKFTDLRESMDEIRSSITILKQAIKNEYDPADKRDIENLLELVSTKLDKYVLDAGTLQSELFVKKK